MKSRKQIKLVLSLVVFTAFLGSCEKFLEVPPKDLLTSEQHFRDKFDADAAVRGIYGKLLNLADTYVILNELRADLLDVTDNADVHLREMNLHQVSAGNPYADPTPFYSLINNCNDALSNFDIMLKDLKFSQEDYMQRYSDIATLRSWLYLQLVIHYGEVPYITTAIDRVDDLDQLTDGSFPMLGIEAMVDTLVATMESLPHLSLYTDPSFRTVIDGFDTRIMFIDKEVFLGDLYLWQGDYFAAASSYKNTLERDIGQNRYDSYRLCFGEPYKLPHFNSGYTRFYNQDINSALNNWPFMFYSPQSNDYYCEWIWALYFHDSYTPTNPFLEIFSKDAGNYLLKPSASIIENWDTQIQRNGFNSDFRGNEGSYEMINGEPVITKHISTYNPIDPFEKGGQWHLWRAGGIHLRFIEAANRDSQYELASALMNYGIRTSYAVPGAVDVTYLERTNLPFPYDFDGRSAGPSQIPAGTRGDWHRNVGVRGRVYLEAREYPASDSLLSIENSVLDESALELAFEGQRWGDLVRIAIRRNDPSILADRIYDKLQSAGYPEAGAVQAKLMERENWFLPLTSDK
jgi:starch-binding outer membrane protein, SusD/RagB family